MSEAAAGRYDVDVIHFGSPEMEALARENILAADRLSGARRSAAGLGAGAQAVGGDAPLGLGAGLQHESGAPRGAAEVVSRTCSIPGGRAGSASRRRTRTGSRRSLTSWAASDEGVEFFRQLVATNGVSVRVGHTLLNNMVISGEVPLALTLYNYMPEQAKKKGAPIDWFTLEPAIARSNAVGIARRAPHPAAARLFYDYLLGEEAQRSFVSMDYVPSNTKVPSPLAGVKILQTDPVRTLDEADKWTKLFEETLLKR